ncbi:hypothetical protein ACFPRL_12090 [Pseudoclavibacter helvolus]
MFSSGLVLNRENALSRTLMQCSSAGTMTPISTRPSRSQGCVVRCTGWGPASRSTSRVGLP